MTNLGTVFKTPGRWLYRGCVGVVRLAIISFDRLLGRRRTIKSAHLLADAIDLTWKTGGISFDCRSPISFHRASTLFSKEPETIAWIDDFIEPGDVLYDVGANIGVFSLYASITKGCKTIAFEPSADNYAELCRNIWKNGLDSRVLAYNVALHDRFLASSLNISKMVPGRAAHTFGSRIDGWGREFTPEFQQGSIGLPLDAFVYDLQQPFPTHIKIDVDGNEHLVMAGMSRILKDLRLRSIAIELNFQDRAEIDGAIADEIIAAGFELLDEDRYGPSRKNPNMTNYFYLRTGE